MILALETSCDETAAALFEPGRGLVGEWVYSQVAAHEPHGGVVPDLAAREHLRHLPLLLERVRDASEGRQPGSIAVTRGPGLAPCLALGMAAAKALALAHRVGLTGINHMRAHAWSPFIGIHAAEPAAFDGRLSGLLPQLGLVASGGHTLLLSIDSDRRIRELASTLDDAAGEALDKGAKLLGLGYPGGCLIEQAANGGRGDAYAFPRGLSGRPGLDFSFSGLKTSLRYLLEKMEPGEIDARRADLCASYQRAVVDALAQRVRAALARGGFRSLGVSGGVSRNAELRRTLAEEARRAGVPFLPVGVEHAGDNAGMIGFAAWADSEGAKPGGMGLEIDPSLGLRV
jgi:N6-L-threonylcarbamoyladenine synthase